jgi:UDP-N-acetylglucosamine 2-epimerase (non-hydrolysing)
MAPVVRALNEDARFESLVLITAQHREMLDQVLSFFEIMHDYDLNIMTHGQTLEQITSRALEGVSEVLENLKPDIVIVHGDTTTTFAAALAAFYHNIPVAHVEAGMRTGDLRQPFPEELNRTMVARLARYHFAPSDECVRHLREESVDEKGIIRTEHNTGIDALLLARSIMQRQGLSIEPENHILVTAHRRESWGEGMRGIFRAVSRIASAKPGFQIGVAKHANPLVSDDAHAVLDGIENIKLLDHQSYEDFVKLMARSRIILSDSGGIQEEGPTLGIPVVVLRNKTEYHELLESGVVFLAGTDEDAIVSCALEVLGDEAIQNRVQSFAHKRVQRSSLPLILDVLANDSLFTTQATG